MHANLDRYYETANTKGYGDGDGLASGEIAPMFEDTTGATGGGKQYDMPFSKEELLEWYNSIYHEQMPRYIEADDANNSQLFVNGEWKNEDIF